MNIQELYAFYREHPVVTTDSRDCPEGSIFIALKGENFDGNAFALKALEQGCSLAVVSDKAVANEWERHPLDGKQLMLVDDTLQTFKDLAREHRRQFAIPVVGITGTNGKTTTKELVRAVLSQRYRVMATEGNYNNDVGVPKTLLRLSAEHDIAVVEMGASHPGDIATLAATAEPTCGLIFVNGDNELLTGILPAGIATERYTQHEVAAGWNVCGEVVACDPFLRLRWRAADGPWHQVNTHLIGSYNLDNALAAVTVGLHFGVTPELIVQAIENYVPSNNRSQLVNTSRNRLVVDAYNANPTSMAAALENFELMQVENKMAILGEMRELGSSSAEEHRRVVDNLGRCHFDVVWLVGKEFAAIDCPYRKFDSVDEVKEAIAAEGLSGYTILIKGSNGTRLYQLPDLL